MYRKMYIYIYIYACCFDLKKEKKVPRENVILSLYLFLFGNLEDGN